MSTMPDDTAATHPEEILAGVYHYTQVHPKIGIEVSSYYLTAERVLIDPMIPGGGIAWFEELDQGPPTDIVLSCRHHYRHAARFVERYGSKVHCVSAGMHEFDDLEDAARPLAFEFGDELPGGLIAHEADAISPDDTALGIPAHGALVCADVVIRLGEDGPLSFVPDQFMDEPPKTKRLIIESCRSLCELDFEHLLLAHGGPVLREGAQKLREFVETCL